MQCDRTVLRYEKGFWSSPKITYRDEAQWKPYCSSSLKINELGAICEEKTDFKKHVLETFKVDESYRNSQRERLSLNYDECFVQKIQNTICGIYKRFYPNYSSDTISLADFVERNVTPLNTEKTRDSGIMETYQAIKTTYIDFYLMNLTTTYKSDESGGPSGGTTTCEVIE